MKPSHITFLFIASIFLLLPLEQSDVDSLLTVKKGLCASLILTFGISHGAIDNILFQDKLKLPTHLFILGYVLIMALTALLWFVFTDVALILFLLISAYHFGQSQFVEFDIKSPLNSMLYLTWGLGMILSLVYFNSAEISSMIISYDQLSTVIISGIIRYANLLWILFSLLSFGLLFYFVHKGRISLQDFFLQIYIFSLILFSFKVMNTLMGFTLYFIILHSVKVLSQEYEFLKFRGTVRTLKHFISLLLPFTISSILGTVIIYAVIQYFDLEISIPILALLIVSCITIPHSIVMDGFYAQGQTTK